MTEKRFTVPIKYRFSHSKIQLNGEPLTNDELVRILNTNDGAFFENFVLKEENEQLKSKNRGLQSELQIFKEDVTHSNLQINKLADENEQLQKENRQLKHWNKCLAEKRLQGYGYYTDNKAEKRIKELFEPKPLNCSDRVKRS